MTPVYWLIAFIVLMIIEIATLALTTIWFAGGAFLAFVAAALGAGVEIQLIVFIVVSFVLLIFTRPLVGRYMNKKHSRTNANSLIGESARVVEEINNRLGTGMVIVAGQEWTARSTDNDLCIEVGKLVKVNEIQGVKLIVKTEKEEF